MRQAALLVAVACLLVVPLSAAVGASGGAVQPAVQQEAVAEEGVHITVQLQPDGDARWNISAVYAIENEQDAAAFAAVAEDFKAGRTDNGFSVDVFRAVVPSVSDRVGRQMEIRDADRSASTVDAGNNSTGVLSLRFTWTNFSQVTNETMVVDSFSGTWFGDLDAGQTLTIRPPAGYDDERVDPGPDTIVNGAYRWTGPQSFGAGQPTVEFTRSPGNGDGGFRLPVALLVGVGAAALLVGGVFAWLYTRDGSVLGALLPDDDGGDGASSAADRDAAESDASGAGGASGTERASDGAAADGAAAADDGDGVDPELLSDEERVERLLREHGGRMKQSKIVEETRWSTAKVSQLLSSMDDEDRVEKLRIGRENLISLPGEGVDDE